VEKVDGVVLAAGLSSRSGRYKMTLALGDRTVIEHCIAGMYDVVSRIVVVVGWQAPRLQELLAGYEKVACVLNERFREGMFTSVRAGIAQVHAPRFFLIPGDYPLVGMEVYERMLGVQGDVVIPTFEGERGHPVLLSRELVPEILAQPADSSLRDTIEAKGYTTVEVDDQGILWDLDTPEDYEHLLAQYRQRQLCVSIL
jgi:molybdenum cofactor cytidylyltransferase